MAFVCYGFDVRSAIFGAFVGIRETGNCFTYVNAKKCHYDNLHQHNLGFLRTFTFLLKDTVIMSLTNRSRASILDKPLSRGKGEVSLSCFALLFSEVVQYCQNKSHTVPELQTRYSNTTNNVY